MQAMADSLYKTPKELIAKAKALTKRYPLARGETLRV